MRKAQGREPRSRAPTARPGPHAAKGAAQPQKDAGHTIGSPKAPGGEAGARRATGAGAAGARRAKQAGRAPWRRACARQRRPDLRQRRATMRSRTPLLRACGRRPGHPLPGAPGRRVRKARPNPTTQTRQGEGEEGAGEGGPRPEAAAPHPRVASSQGARDRGRKPQSHTHRPGAANRGRAPPPGGQGGGARAASQGTEHRTKRSRRRPGGADAPHPTRPSAFLLLHLCTSSDLHQEGRPLRRGCGARPRQCQLDRLDHPRPHLFWVPRSFCLLELAGHFGRQPQVRQRRRGLRARALRQRRALPGHGLRRSPGNNRAQGRRGRSANAIAPWGNLLYSRRRRGRHRRARTGSPVGRGRLGRRLQSQQLR